MITCRRIVLGAALAMLVSAPALTADEPRLVADSITALLDAIDALVEHHSDDIAERPDLEHAPGWWMVSRLSAEGQEPGAVHELRGQPYTLFDRYNARLTQADQDLRVDPRVEAIVGL